MGNYQEAPTLEAELKMEAKAGGRVAASKLTVTQLFDAYFETGTWSPSTLYGYKKTAAREITPDDRIGKIKIGDLRADKIDRVYKAMRDRGLGNRSAHNVHSLLHGALEQACKWGWLTVNVADRASPGSGKAGKGVMATRTEIEQIMAAANPQLRLAVHLAAATGVRRSELCGFQWSDVDFERGTIQVERAIIDSGGHTVEKGTKTHQVRTIQLNPQNLAVLREHRGIGPIIRWSPRALSQHLADICDELGIVRTNGRQRRIGWHSFRHYCGTVVAKTGDITAASRRLGHSRTSTTLDMYVHGDEEADRAAPNAAGLSFG